MTYQEEQELSAEKLEPRENAFATIAGIYEDGVTLIFDGEENASEKHYKVNTSVTFNAGDRVKIAKDSGTYIVEYPIGNPKIDDGSGSGTVAEAEHAKTADKATMATTADQALAIKDAMANINIEFTHSSYLGLQYKVGPYGSWITIG